MQALVIVAMGARGATNLVRGLVEVLGVKRRSQAEFDTRAEVDIVCHRRDAAVIDLSLLGVLKSADVHHPTQLLAFSCRIL